MFDELCRKSATSLDVPRPSQEGKPYLIAFAVASQKGNHLLARAMLAHGAGIDSTTYSFLFIMVANVHVSRLEFFYFLRVSDVGDVGSRTYK